MRSAGRARGDLGRTAPGAPGVAARGLVALVSLGAAMSLVAPAEAAPVIEPPELWLGDLFLPYEQLVQVRNPGAAPLTLTSVALVGAGAPAFTLSGLAPSCDGQSACDVSIQLDPGQALAFTLFAWPLFLGPAPATLELASDDGSASAIVHASFTSPPALTLMPEVWEFPVANEDLGFTSLTFELSNSAPAGPALIYSFDLPAAHFRVAECGMSWHCEGALASGETKTFHATYYVNYDNSAIDVDVPIWTNLSLEPRLVRLRARTGSGWLELLPQVWELDFGGGPVGIPSVSQTIRARNAGDAPLRVFSVYGSCGDSPLLVDGMQSGELAPGQETTWTFRAVPSQHGALHGDLWFDTAASTMPAILVSCRGYGEGVAAMPDTLAFGNVPIGDLATRTYQLVNTGALPHVVEAVTATGGGAARFSVSLRGVSLPHSFAPGESLPVDVTYAPDAAQPDDTIVVASVPEDGELGWSTYCYGNGVAPSAGSGPTELPTSSPAPAPAVDDASQAAAARLGGPQPASSAGCSSAPAPALVGLMWLVALSLVSRRRSASRHRR